MRVLQFALSKVSCAGCVRSIERALKSVDEIDDFAINFADRSATIESSLSSEDLIKLIEDAGYGASLIEDENDVAARDADNIKVLKQSFKHAWLALFVGALLMIQMLLGALPAMDSVAGMINGLVTGVISLYVMIRSGGHIYRGALSSFKRLSFNMDTLIALGTGAAWFYSFTLLVIVNIDSSLVPIEARHLYFEASVMIIGFILLGQALEMRGRIQTADALKHLINLQPKKALKVTPEGIKEVSIQLLLPGDLVRVRPSETVPVDGIIEEGSAYIDESMLTGESLPLLRSIGDKVTGGTKNGHGVLVLRVTEVGKQSRLSQILSSVRDAQNTKPALGRLADQISAVFVPVVMLISLVTGALWWMLGPDPSWSFAILVALTILIVACPCALGLATPMAVMVGVGRAAKLGILIRQGDALQRAQDLTCVVMDKTGTLTEGKPSVVGSMADQFHTDLAAELASHSDHPLSKAISALSDSPFNAQLEQVLSVTGSGLEAKINNKTIRLGSSAWLASLGIDQGEYAQSAKAWLKDGCSLVWLFDDHHVLALYALSDPLREDSKAAIDRFHALGLRLVMLSGDHPDAAHSIAKRAGILEVIAGVQPEQKREKILELQAAGEVVAMIGDGINDAPALAQADVGYGMGGGTDVAIAAADVVLMQNSLHAVVNAISLSRATVLNIKQNLAGAFLYNTAAIPLAAGILYPFFGVMLNPMIAGAAMALSSVTVVANARRLRGVELR